MQRLVFGAGLAAVLAMACGDDLPGAGPADASTTPDAAVPDARPVGGPSNGFVVNTVELPLSAAEAQQLGLNIDNDPNDTVDNALGAVLSVLENNGGNAQGVIDQSLIDGEMINLIDLRADSVLDDPVADVRLFAGDDADNPVDPTNNFSGDGMFRITPGTSLGSILAANVTSGHVSAGPGIGLVNFVFLENTPPLQLELVGARVEADITPGGLVNGKLAGALTENTVTTVVVPALAVSFNMQVAIDCPGGVCVPGSAGEQLLALFDENSDGTITEAELTTNPLFSALLAPDVDLFDMDGVFNPNTDGVNDSLSLGVAFTAVNATFPSP